MSDSPLHQITISSTIHPEKFIHQTIQLDKIFDNPLRVKLMVWARGPDPDLASVVRNPSDGGDVLLGEADPVLLAQGFVFLLINQST